LAVCEAVDFFHPVFHFVKRRILFERERACDGWVIAAGKTRRSIYAHALINAADVCRSFRTKVGPVGAVAESFADLKKRLMALASNFKPRARLSLSALILLVIIGTICVPGIVLTARSEGESEKTDAQVGTAGLLTDDKQKATKFVATLPNGVTVELIGVCEHPSEGKKWWRPDGAILESDHAPSDYSRMTVKPDETEQARELALRFAGRDVEHMSFRWKMDVATRSSSHPFYVTEKREKLKPLRNIVFKLPRNLETLDSSIGIATGEWKGVASGGDGRTVSATNDSLTDSSVIFHKAVKEKDTLKLCVTHLLGRDYDCRIVVVDRDDQIHEPMRSSNSGSDMRLCEGFFVLSQDQIEYVLLQARPYEWITFRNVSLRPGHKTDVQVEVAERPETVVDVHNDRARIRTEGTVIESERIVLHPEPAVSSQRQNFIERRQAMVAT